MKRNVGYMTNPYKIEKAADIKTLLVVMGLSDDQSISSCVKKNRMALINISSMAFMVFENNKNYFDHKAGSLQ